MKIKITLLIILSSLFSCDDSGYSFSNYLREKRISGYLKSKPEAFKKAYRKMGFYESRDGEYLVTFYWKEEIIQKKYEVSPCKKVFEKEFKYLGRAFERFNHILEFAISENYQALRFRDDSKTNKGKVRFYTCKKL